MRVKKHTKIGFFFLRIVISSIVRIISAIITTTVAITSIIATTGIITIKHHIQHEPQVYAPLTDESKREDDPSAEHRRKVLTIVAIVIAND